MLHDISCLCNELPVFLSGAWTKFMLVDHKAIVKEMTEDKVVLMVASSSSSSSPVNL